MRGGQSFFSYNTDIPSDDADVSRQDDVKTLYVMFRRNGRKLRGDHRATSSERVHHCALFRKIRDPHEHVRHQQDPHAPAGSLDSHLREVLDISDEWNPWNTPQSNANAEHAPEIAHISFNADADVTAMEAHQTRQRRHMEGGNT